MPTPYFAGQTTTIRSLPESTKHLIHVLTTALRCTQAEAVSAAVEAYFDSLAENGKVDDAFVHLVQAARARGRLERRKPRPPNLVDSDRATLTKSSGDSHKYECGGAVAPSDSGRVTPTRSPQEMTAESAMRTGQPGEQADLRTKFMSGVTRPDISIGLSPSLTDSDAGHS